MFNFKVWSADRQQKKMVSASTVEELLRKGKCERTTQCIVVSHMLNDFLLSSSSSCSYTCNDSSDYVSFRYELACKDHSTEKARDLLT